MANSQIKKINVLIIAGETGQLNYYREVASRMMHQGLNVSLCCDRDDPGVLDKVAITASELGIDYFHHKGDRGTLEEEPKYFEIPLFRNINVFFSIFRNFFNRKKLENISNYCLSMGISKTEYLAMFNYHSYRLNNANEILTINQTDIIVTGEDGIASDYWLINAAKRRGIKVVTIPYGIADSKSLIYKGIEEKYLDGSLFTIDSPGGKYIQTHYPHWIKRTKYGMSLFLPPSFILALEKLNISIPNPWCFQGGISDLIFSEGEIMKSRYINEGIDPKKITLTGSIYSDILFDAFKNHPTSHKAYLEFNKPSLDKTRVLICVPPGESESWTAKSEFNNIVSYVNAINHKLSTVKALKITYSFHPRMNPIDRKSLQLSGINESDQFVIELIPENDVVIICGSSISRWAIAARKIVIDFDLFKFGLIEFPSIPCYLPAPDFKSVVEEIMAIVNDPSRYSSLIKRSLHDSNKMGAIDGLACSRMVKKIQCFVENKGA
jgi:hypothetical protein